MRLETAPPADGAADALRHSNWLHLAWPMVRIESVAAEWRGGRHRVSAVVRLGTLTPADVHVGLMPAAEADPLSTALATESARSGADRMWSCASYGNGCFVFERELSAADTPSGARAPSDWVVFVVPTRAAAARPVLYPLRLDATP